MSNDVWSLQSNAKYKSKTSEEDKKLNVHVYFKKFKLGKGIT